MSKKLIIQIIIIVGAFGAAGIIIYNGFFNHGSAPASAVAAASAPIQSPDQILPYGSSSFDFSSITGRPFIFNEIQYPSVNTSTEVGVPVSGLIQSNGLGQ